MCRKLVCLALFVVPVLSLIGNAQAGEATADAFVRGPSNDNTNYGTGSSVTLKNTNGNSYDRKGYIRFEIAGAASEASLELTVSTNNNGGGGTTPQTFTIEVYGLAESLDHTWTEGEITWNNAPGNDTSNSEFTADATLLGSFIVEPLPVGNVVSFSDPALVDFINSDTDGQITILLRRTAGTSTSHNVAFASKEHSSYSPPTLNTRVATQASAPNPANEATDLPRDVVLSWMPGIFAPPVNGHIVYLSDNFSDVNDGIGGIALDANSYAPSTRLDLGTTYYWRVDEVNAPPDNTVFKGSVWSFTVEPFATVIPGEEIIVTASSTNRAEEGPGNTINGSGLDDDDLHSVEATDMWLGSGVDPNATWIQYEFDRVHKLYQMSVWNYNTTVEAIVGFGIKEATIEYSVDGVDWVILGTTHEFARGPGSLGYAPDTTVDLSGVAARYVKITAISNWGGIVNQFGLSEVRFSSVPVLAREPNPVPDAANVDVDATLSFRAGREAAEHHLYLGTDEQAVIDGNAPVVAVTEPSYAPSLDLASTYYWRIDEVNDVESPTSWQGDLWSFSTQEYLVVDDFEGFDVDNPIWETWLDGLGFGMAGTPGFNPGNGTGAAVGDENSPSYMEETIVHGGNKSVPFGYNNAAAGVSEIARTLTPAQDWTVHGIQTLSLWFFGDVNNVPGQLYVKVNGAKVDYDGEAGNLTAPAWRTWNIDLASIGVNLQSVTSLAVGIEGGSASGKLLLDDIRLYSYDRQLITPAEPDPAGLQAHYEFEGTADDSSGNGRHGTAMGGATFAPGKIGQAVNLDGVDDYVTITGYKGIVADRSDPNNPVQPEFSVACWINKTSDGSLVGWGSSDGTGVGGQYQNFRIDGGRLRAEHGNGRFRGAAVINDGEWHHVVMTVAQGANLWPPGTQLYVDGHKDTEGADTVNAQNIWNLTPDADVGIGVRVTHDDRFFTGMIDDVRIYDRVLTHEEVAGLAGRTLPFDNPF